VSGQWVFNNSSSCARAYVPEDMVLEDIAPGRLVRVLDDWCPPYPGTTCTTQVAANQSGAPCGIESRPASRSQRA
jgi:DNA-binding transcriptional LysR family regulator